MALMLTILLARIYDVSPLVCPTGGAMRIPRLHQRGAGRARDLRARGRTDPPRRLAPARGPPLWEMPDAEPGESDPRASPFDPQAQPALDYEFNQRIAW